MEQQNQGLLRKNLAQIFPTYVLGYDDPKASEHIPLILDYVNQGKWSPAPHQPYQTIDNHLHERPELKSFFDWVHLVLEDYRRTWKYHTESIKVNLSWVNKSDSNGAHQQHVHPNSFISGVYYLSKDSSPTLFEDPRYQTRSGLMVASDSEMAFNTWGCPSNTGSLILFPSWLPHYTVADSEIQPGDYRYTLSFNSLPYGNTNTGSLIEIQL